MKLTALNKSFALDLKDLLVADFPTVTLESLALPTKGSFAMGPFGSDIKTDNFVDFGVPIIKGQNLGGGRLLEDFFDFLTEEKADELSNSIAKSGDIVFTHRGTLGQVAMIPRKSRYPRYIVSQSQMKVSLDEEQALPEYVTYYFQSSVGQHMLMSYASQTGVPAIGQPLTSLRKMLVILPSIEEQRAIAGVLGALDDKIESNRRLQLLLDAVIQAEFVRAANGSNLVHFGHSLDVVMGAPFGGDHFGGVGHGRPLIRIRDLKTFAPQTWTTESRADEVLVRAGDVVVGMDAEFRSTLWVGEVGLLNQRVCKCVPKAGVATAFAWYAIRSDLEFCERAKSGTTVIHLNKGDIDRFSVPELGPTEHQDFSDLTEPMLNRLVSAGLENLRLAALRDALLPELLSGRLRVKDAESVMENV